VDELPTEVFLDGYPTPIREAANKLRSIVRQAVPDAVEGIRPGWRLIAYSVPVGRRRQRLFAAVGPEPRHCHLFFEYGAFIPDPERLLEGAQLRLKQVRYLTFTSSDEVGSVPGVTLERYLLDAVRVATMTREQRLSLVP
jgi:hypothetical protein